MNKLSLYKISNLALSEAESKYGIETISPIIGANLSAKEYFSAVLPLYNTAGKLLSPAEVGCALSHIYIYEKILQTKQAAIIFEADISPTTTQLEIANKLCSNTSADFIHLGWHPDVEHGRFFKGKKNNGQNLYEVDPSVGFYGAFAYYVSVKMAQELYSYHKESIKLADSWARFFLTSDIIPYFYPIFSHPPARNEMHNERLAVSQNVHALNISNIKIVIRKLLIQKLAPLKLWNQSIVPDRDSTK